MITNLHGSTALVTGASSGIGLASARLLARLGTTVAVSARRVPELESLAEELGNGAIAIEADISDETSATAAVVTAWQKLGHIDILIHAAGIVTPAPISELTPALWRRHLDVNLSGAFYVMRQCGLRMRERAAGSIVAVASDLSFNGMENYAHYCASKAGLAGFAKALALELAPNVRVNCVCPGPVDTPIMESELQWFGGTPQVRESAVAQVPLKRFATPEEIARFIVFVASEATFATGSMLSTDGGTTAR
ncbi:SDR family NAD(P)-dependent oxidoreductase [Sinorhizobium saheli]|uniref:Short-chain dehydrogenase n=1 Tax=Sinorhizobium saheli TaxID=36856 RepID=A0A178XTG8_SINSA|nr:SDR family oxidoreductase [Sinorhizobium saheli]OAP38113.1 short-chain dehydrogenase [Sinorhizobium saheli]